MPNWLGGMVCAVGLAGCGGSAAPSSAAGLPSTTVADADSEVWRALSAYAKTIRESDAFDECLTGQPQQQPWKCLRGPRSATRLGYAVHDWLRGELASIDGLHAVQTQHFQIPLFRPLAYGLRVDFGSGEEEVAAFPWYYRGITLPRGVSGELVDVGNGSGLNQLLLRDLAGKIAVMKVSLLLNSEEPSADERLAQLTAKGAAAAIVATDAPGNLIAAQNFDIGNALGGLPTVIVGAQDGERIAAAAGQTATVTVSAEYRAGPDSVPATLDGLWGTERNTVAVLPGRDHGYALVIGTPLNTWLTGTGERGPGVGTLVYLARYLAQRAREEGSLPYDVWFVGTGGHELFGFGINRMLSCFAQDQVYAYVHLGSGLVYPGYTDPLVPGGDPQPTGVPSQVRTLAVSENTLLQGIAIPAFSDPVLQPFFTLPPSLFVPGENRGPYARGIPTIGMNGTNAYFHTAADDEMQIVRAALGPMAVAFRDSVDALLATDAQTLLAANAVAALLGGALQSGEDRDWECAQPLQQP